MRRAVALLPLVCILSSPEALAQQPPPENASVPVRRPLSQTSLKNAIERDIGRLKFARPDAGNFLPQQPATRDRNWPRRHPALFGAAIGAAAGAASAAPRWNELYCATGGDEDCFFHGGTGVLFGAGLGAGIGALIGRIVGR